MKKNVLFLFAALSMPLIYANKKATVSVDLTYVGSTKLPSRLTIRQGPRNILELQAAPNHTEQSVINLTLDEPAQFTIHELQGNKVWSVVAMHSIQPSDIIFLQDSGLFIKNYIFQQKRP